MPKQRHLLAGSLAISSNFLQFLPAEKQFLFKTQRLYAMSHIGKHFLYAEVIQLLLFKPPCSIKASLGAPMGPDGV